MTTILLTINVLICVALVLIILLQRNDPNAGGMFGGTGGAGGPAIRNPLAKPTAYLAAAFMIISLVIAYTTKGAGEHTSVVEGEHAAAPTEHAPSPDAAAAAEADLLAPVAPTPEVPAEALPEPAVPGTAASPERSAH